MTLNGAPQTGVAAGGAGPDQRLQPDVLDLTSFGIPSAGYTQATANSANQQLAAGHSFTLSDGTTVVFTGTAKPTVIHS